MGRRKRMITEYAKLNIAHRGLTVYRVGDPGWRWGWNHYGYPVDRTIGIAFVTGRVCWSIVWGRA
jgi:hypothetical protein